MSDKQTVTLDIAGAKYRMTSDADPEHLERLATMINDRLSDLGAKAIRTASPAQMLAVIALSLADDLVSAEDRRRQVESVTRKAIGEAIRRIDARLEADSRSQANPAHNGDSED